MDADSRSRCGGSRRAAACRRIGVRADDHVEARAGRGDHGRGRGPERRTSSRRSRRTTTRISSSTEIDRDLASNAKHLVAAKKSLVVAQERIAERLRDLYVNGEGDSTLEVILGSSSLDDIIARLDAIERVSSQDTQILRTVKRYRKEVETRRENLQEARADQARIVAEQAAQKQSIESQIAEQNQLLASVKDEIAQMRAEEQRRRPRLRRRRARVRRQLRSSPARRSSTSRSRRYDTAVVAPDLRPEPPRRSLRPRRRDRAPVPRRALRLGRLEPVDRIRLLRLHELRLRTGRRVASAPRRIAVRLRDAGAVRPARSRRPRLLQRPRPRRASTSAAASSSTRRTPATS